MTARTACAAIVVQQWWKDYPMTDPEQNVTSEQPTFTRESALKLAAGGVLAVASYLAAGFLPPSVFYLIYIVVLITVAYRDFRERIIPNRIIYPAILVALGAMFRFPGWSRIPGWSIALLGGMAAALPFTIPICIYGPDLSGVGDVKLAFFVGLIFGFSVTLLKALLVFAFSAAVVAVVGILLRKMTLKSTMPFGPFLALGAIVLLITQMGGAVAALAFIVPVFTYGLEQAGIGNAELTIVISIVFGLSMTLLWVLLVGFGSAALVGSAGILLRKTSRKSLLPFGTFLALGGIALLITQYVDRIGRFSLKWASRAGRLRPRRKKEITFGFQILTKS